jgi:hypothetical protein
VYRLGNCNKEAKAHKACRAIESKTQLIIGFFFHLPHAGKKMGAHWLFIDVKKAYHSNTREVFYNILAELGITMKLIGVIKKAFK